ASALSAGQYTAQAEQDDAAGNHGFSAADTFMLTTNAPTNISRPSISGSTMIGQTLHCSPGRWSSGTSQSYVYQWFRNGNPISGTTSPIYKITAADLGATLVCRVTARNGNGTSTATSAAITIPTLYGKVTAGQPRVKGT